MGIEAQENIGAMNDEWAAFLKVAPPPTTWCFSWWFSLKTADTGVPTQKTQGDYPQEVSRDEGGGISSTALHTTQVSGLASLVLVRACKLSAEISDLAGNKA